MLIIINQVSALHTTAAAERTWTPILRSDLDWCIWITVAGGDTDRDKYFGRMSVISPQYPSIWQLPETIALPPPFLFTELNIVTEVVIVDRASLLSVRALLAVPRCCFSLR